MTMAQQVEGLDFCLSAAGTVLTSSATTYSTANTLSFVLDGKFYSKTAISATAAPTVDAKVTAFGQQANLNANSGLLVLQPQTGAGALWCMDPGGNVYVFFTPAYPLDGGSVAGQGNFLVAPDLSGLMGTLPPAGVNAFGYPTDGAGASDGDSDLVVPFAYSIHRNQNTLVSNTTWQFGVNNWNASNITSTVQDICCVPSRRQVA